MHLLFQAYFLAIFFVMTVKGDGASPFCPKPYDKMMICNLMCNLLQDSSSNDAMKMLQAKLESLIAVLNKPGIAQKPGTLLQTWTTFKAQWGLLSHKQCF